MCVCIYGIYRGISCDSSENELKSYGLISISDNVVKPNVIEFFSSSLSSFVSEGRNETCTRTERFLAWIFFCMFFTVSSFHSK